MRHRSRLVRVALVTLVCVGASLALRAQQPAGRAASDQPTFRSGINFVTVDAYVTDNKGNAVTDLTQSDFEVFEDDKPQAIEQFRLVKVDGNPRPGDPPPAWISEAVADLYGYRPGQRITLPLSMPGVIAGSMLVFIPALGDFVTPALLGGTRTVMFGNTVQDQFLGGGNNWPLGSAMAVILMVLITFGVLVELRRSEEAFS